MTSTFNWMLQCVFCCCAATVDVSPCNVFQFKQAEHINKREWHWAVFKGCFFPARLCVCRVASAAVALISVYLLGITVWYTSSRRDVYANILGDFGLLCTHSAGSSEAEAMLFTLIDQNPFCCRAPTHPRTHTYGHTYIHCNFVSFFLRFITDSKKSKKQNRANKIRCLCAIHAKPRASCARHFVIYIVVSKSFSFGVISNPPKKPHTFHYVEILAHMESLDS